jgi:hypothetical protein
MIMGCLDAVVMGDSRDVWTLSTKGEVKSYLDKYCIEMGSNPGD